MTAIKLQSIRQLHAEMRAVATGDRSAPLDAEMPSAESADAVQLLLTNRDLPRVIRDKLKIG